MTDLGQIARDIKKLERRLDELKNDDPRSERLVPETLVQVFGARSRELMLWNDLQLSHVDGEMYAPDYSAKAEDIKLLESFVVALRERRDDLEASRQLVDTSAPRVCMNGHVVSSQGAPWIATRPGLKFRPEAYCSECGEPVVTACENCERRLPSFTRTPAYCAACGKPYPWTLRTIDAARDLAGELDALTVEERGQLADTLPDLVADTPKTPLAVTRFRKLATKAGGAAAKMLQDIVIKVATEAATKAILGP
jgi:hypothetical protein